MILCQVCGTANPELAVTCASCHGYLQSRADALDLFSTILEVIERPARAFRGVALATHKNFAIVLASLFGIYLIFAAMWFTGFGDRLPSLLQLLMSGLVLGPPAGVAVILGLSCVVVWLGRRMGGEATFRNTFAVMAYSTVPLCLSLIFVLPVEVGIFGVSLFSTAPSAAMLKPTIFMMLAGIQVASLVWFFVLTVSATSVVHDLGRGKGSVMAAVIACSLVGCFYVLTRF